MWSSKNPRELFFNANNDFKSKLNHDSTASHPKHPVCLYLGEDIVKSITLE